MNLNCLLHYHDWDGCRCRHCEKVRDEQHDWNHCRCRRCGVSRYSCHDWQDCQCTVCRKEQHHFLNGVCTVCQKVCDHSCGPNADSQTYPPSILGGQPGSFSWVCADCGMRVRAKWNGAVMARTTEAQPTAEAEQ